MNALRKLNVFSIMVILIILATACAPAATPQPTPVPPTPQTIVQTQVVEKQVVQTVVVPAATTPPFDCKGKKMAYASFGSQFAFIAIVDKSVQEAAKKAGVDLLFLDNKNDPAQAVTNAETIASRGNIDLVMEFNYYQQQNYVIKDIFNEAKIPVIAIDIPIPGAVYYGADNYEAGRLAGLGLVDAAKAKWGDNSVDLVLVEQQSLAGQQELEKRTSGIIAGIKKGMPDFPDKKIIRVEGGTNVDAAAEAISTNLTAHPEAKHVLVGMLGDSNAIAALNVAESAKRDVLASGIGGDDVGINALRTNKPAGFVGTTLFRPEMYGYDLIPLACDMLAGKQVPPDVYIKHVFLTAANLNQYYPK